MTDNEIIRVLGTLEQYDGLQQKYKIGLHNALDLINHQKTEIEGLKKENAKMFERWEILSDKTKKHYAKLYDEALEMQTSEAIKEFAERLKYKIVNTQSIFLAQKGTHEFLSGNAHRQLEILDYIDILVKEITEVKEQ